MARLLPTVRGGSLIFLDANILIYALLGESAECAELIERCRKEEVVGVTSTEVVGEVCHPLWSERRWTWASSLGPQHPHLSASTTKSEV